MSGRQTPGSGEIVNASDVVLFMKGTPLFPAMRLFPARAIAILDHLGVAFDTVDVLQDAEVRQGIKAYSDWPTIPQLYVKGRIRRRIGHHDGDVRGPASCSSCSRKNRSRARPDFSRGQIRQC
jgi:glutaredoxin-related protein